MEKNAVEAVLNPVARLVPGALGAVDFDLAPAYDDIASLYFEVDHWLIHPADITLQPYTEQTLRAKPVVMTAHARAPKVYRPRKGRQTRDLHRGRLHQP
ncbi:MAG TPA: hypothetical protein VFT74_17815 [Isosphaeraceae bacterium]|nr:hypothetical protein [Isosphaeraceae bacterium]